MKTKVIISLLGLLFISGDFLGGCDEEKPKPDYITVNVITKGKLVIEDANSGIQACDDNTRNKSVRVDVIKDGGEQFNFSYVTNFSCEFTSETASFKLYREQPIEIIAYAELVPGGYTQIRGTDYLAWDEVYPQYNFGDTYNYTSIVRIRWLQD